MTTAKDVERISHLRCLHERTNAARQRCRDAKAAGPLHTITDQRATLARELEAMAQKLRDHPDTLPLGEYCTTFEIRGGLAPGAREQIQAVADAWKVPTHTSNQKNTTEILVVSVQFGEMITYHLQSTVARLDAGLPPLR